MIIEQRKKRSFQSNWMLRQVSRCNPCLLSTHSKCTKAQRHLHKAIRWIITSSTAPPIDTPIERPETIVLLESSLYQHQWKDAFTSYFPNRGLHFATIDVADNTLESMEETLSNDIATLSESAYTIMVARGPLQSLVAQYYLESLPLAGLVLVDPLLLPEDGRSIGSGEKRWNESIDRLLLSLDKSAPGNSLFRKQKDATDAGISLSSSLSRELNLLESLSSTIHRPLYLEPSSVPILVLYSCHPYMYQAQQCAEHTAKFHGVDGVNALCIPMNEYGADDLDWVTEKVYEWYDECVA